MRTTPTYGRSNPLKPVLAMALVAAVVGAIFVLNVPSRIASLGSGNLNALVSPTSRAVYGEPIRLAGRTDRPPLEVTASRAVVARSLTKGVHPASGSRFVAVEVTMENIGDEPWTPDLGTSMAVIDAHGGSHGSDPRVKRVRGARVLPLGRRLASKHSLRGVAVFEVPRSATVAQVTFTVGMGLTRTAEWH